MIEVGRYVEYGSRIFKITELSSNSVFFEWLPNCQLDYISKSTFRGLLKDGIFKDITEIYGTPMGKVLLGDESA